MLFLEALRTPGPGRLPRSPPPKATTDVYLPIYVWKDWRMRRKLKNSVFRLYKMEEWMENCGLWLPRPRWDIDVSLCMYVLCTLSVIHQIKYKTDITCHVAWQLISDIVFHQQNGAEYNEPSHWHAADKNDDVFGNMNC